VTLVAAGDETVLPEPAAKALARLRIATSLDDAAVGAAGMKSETYRAYEVLRDTAPAGALVALTGDKRPIVRCYAFRALAEKHPRVDLFAILKRHLEDVAKVDTFRGCMMAGEKVGDVMIQDARARLHQQEEGRLLGLLINKESKLAARASLLRTAMVPVELLPELRRLVDAGDQNALIAVARHKKPEDVGRIEAALRAKFGSLHPDLLPAFRAATIHPDPKLLPALEALAPRARIELKQKAAQRLRFLFEALAAQQSPRATEVLAGFLGTQGLESHVRVGLATEILKAVGKTESQAHTNLLWRVWDEFGQLDEATARRLFEHDPKRAATAVMRDVRADLNRVDVHALKVLLERVGESDRASAEALVGRALSRADVHHFAVYARLAGTWKSKETLAPLFEVFQTKTNPQIYIAAAKALLAYDRPDIDKRVEKLAKLKHIQESWGAKALRKVLTDKPRDGE